MNRIENSILSLMVGSLLCHCAPARTLPESGSPNALAADDILKTPPQHNAQLRQHNGAMTLFLDGKPITGQMWSCLTLTYVGNSYIHNVIKGLDYPIVAIPFAVGENIRNRLFDTTWTGEDEYDWTYIDKHARRVLNVRADVKLVLMLAFDGATWWTAKYPESANTDYDRKGRCLADKGIPDYLSPEWKRASREVLRQLIAHVQTSDWGRAVIGYELFNGPTMDCNFRVPYGNTRAINDFREYLTLHYRNDLELQNAWRMPSVTFQTALPQVDDMPEGLVLEPAFHQRFLDTRQFFVHQHQQVLSDFAAIVKEATHGRSLVGARTGNLFGNYGWNGVVARVENESFLRDYCSDPNLDFIDVQEPYPGRMLGHGSGVPVLPPHALYKHNKAIFIQNDVRTHLSKANAGYGRTPNLESTIQLQRRVFANSLTYGMIPYLFQLAFKYNQEELLAEYRVQEHIMRKALHNDRTSVAEVAMVLDPDMRLYFGSDTEHTKPSRYFTLCDFTKHVWQRGGAPIDMIFLDQIEELPPYRVYVFCHTWRFTAKQRQVIKDNVFTNGQTAVFLWSDGLIGQDGYFDCMQQSELMGFDVQLSREPQTWTMSATEELAQRVEIETGAEVGILKRQQYDACAPDAGEWRFTPSFDIDANRDSIILARRKDNKAGAVMRNYADYTTVYSVSGNMTVPLFKLALQTSKAFEYTGSEALLMMNRSYIAFHAYKDECIELKLPQREQLRDLFSERVFDSSTIHHMEVEKNGTYLFERIGQ